MLAILYIHDLWRTYLVVLTLLLATLLFAPGNLERGIAVESS